MALYTTETEWHDLRLDPDDLPDDGEPILITVETFLNRQTWIDAHMKYADGGKPIFYCNAVNEDGFPEESVVWYPVIAWAYPPEPFTYF